MGIDSPFIKDLIFATLELENKAIATSGIYKRKWNINLGSEIGNKEYNHIINPISEINNNEIISITLISDNCYLVDAYATACIAM
ncbi:MAG: FAD:protein FMN transferase [bacterium]